MLLYYEKPVVNPASMVFVKGFYSDWEKMPNRYCAMGVVREIFSRMKYFAKYRNLSNEEKVNEINSTYVRGTKFSLEELTRKLSFSEYYGTNQWCI